MENTRDSFVRHPPVCRPRRNVCRGTRASAVTGAASVARGQCWCSVATRGVNWLALSSSWGFRFPISASHQQPLNHGWPHWHWEERLPGGRGSV